jgi:membrane protein DedA with SNARE-associated domain
MAVAFITAGYPVLAMAVLLGAFGAPLPLTVALSVAGSLARQGRLDLAVLFVVCAAASVAGDSLGYAVGRFGLRRLPLPPIGAAWMARLQRFTRSRRPMCALVFLTRWAITAPAPFVNLAVGARRYPWQSFLLVDAAGEALWCTLAIAPGFLLGASGAISLPLSLAAGAVLTLIGVLLTQKVLPRL